METIIGILFLLLPLILKLIGRKLDKSGKPGKAREVRDFVEVLDEEQKPVPPADCLQGITEPEKLEQAPVVHVVEKLDVPTSEGMPVVTRKPILMEEEPVRKGEKIDPKKLVIYSEIMKPKF